MTQELGSRGDEARDPHRPDIASVSTLFNAGTIVLS